MEAFLTALTTGLLSGGAIASGVVYLARKSIDAAFDAKLENIRSDFRRDEERLKADLAAKGREIDALRAGALSGITARGTELYKRRLQAVESLMKAVSELSRLVFLVKIAQVTNLQAVREAFKRGGREKDAISRTFGTFVQNLPEAGHFGQLGAMEKPFVAEYTWALFAAFSTSLFYFYALFSMFKIGAGSEAIASPDHMIKMVKEAMPEYANYLDQNGESGLSYVVDLIEKKLIQALRDDLADKSTTESEVWRSAEIIKLASEVAPQEPPTAPLPGFEVRVQPPEPAI